MAENISLHRNNVDIYQHTTGFHFVDGAILSWDIYHNNNPPRKHVQYILKCGFPTYSMIAPDSRQ